MGCYLAAYVSAGNTVKVGDVVSIPGIGDVTILANGDLVEGQETAPENNGVVLLPERVVFTAENVADYLIVPFQPVKGEEAPSGASPPFHGAGGRTAARSVHTERPTHRYLLKEVLKHG